MASMGYGYAESSNHVCLIYESEDQRRKTVSDYLADGIRQGELVRYFADVSSPESVRAWLAEIGIEVPGVEESGAFTIYSAETAYCPDGFFDPQATITRIMQRYVTAEQAGFTGSRVGSEMSWALKGLRGSERFLEYEVLLNTISTHFPHTGMCQYDARLFDGATLFNVLQVHPFMVAQGQIVKNPYFVKPEEYLSKAGLLPKA